MRLSEVSIENYRSICTCKIRFRELTALVGENNAGKTAILRALNSFFNFEKRHDTLTTIRINIYCEP